MNLSRTREAMAAMGSVPGFQLPQRRCFNEFAVRTPFSPGVLNQRLLEKGILGGLDLGRWEPRWEGLWLLCCTEARSPEDVQHLLSAVREVTHGR
jgi:glycine dehydrogenase subunit 1